MNFFKYPHRTDDLTHAFSSSAVVERGMTGRICRKFPDNKISVPPKSCPFSLELSVYDQALPMHICESLVIRVHSSYTISSHVWENFAHSGIFGDIAYRCLSSLQIQWQFQC